MERRSLYETTLDRLLTNYPRASLQSIQGRLFNYSKVSLREFPDYQHAIQQKLQFINYSNYSQPSVTTWS